MEEVECPYCEEYIEIYPDEHYEGYEEYQCSSCGKFFEVYAEQCINYSVQGRADCLNGEEHNWKPIFGVPEIYFRGKYRCRDCSKEMTIESELATEEEIMGDI